MKSDSAILFEIVGSCLTIVIIIACAKLHEVVLPKLCKQRKRTIHTPLSFLQEYVIQKY